MVPHRKCIRVTINPAPKYAVFRVSDKRQIKARLAGNGCSIDKSCNAELALIRSPYLFDFNKLGQRVSARSYVIRTCFRMTKAAL
jgi:hypothetical protein